MKTERRIAGGRERGSVLVEAALILPILLLLVFGIIDFSRAYNAKQALTHASREAVRVFVVTEDAAKTQAAFAAAVVALDGATLDPMGAGCTPGEQVTATARYTFDFLVIPFASVNMDTEAVMRCGG
jgi:Flp pilus assembly protein TadG